MNLESQKTYCSPSTLCIHLQNFLFIEVIFPHTKSVHSFAEHWLTVKVEPREKLCEPPFIIINFIYVGF